jgi:hypothetical protein
MFYQIAMVMVLFLLEKIQRLSFQRPFAAQIAQLPSWQIFFKDEVFRN